RVRAVLFFFQAEDGIRDRNVTGVQTCALPISSAETFFRVDSSLRSFFGATYSGSVSMGKIVGAAPKASFDSPDTCRAICALTTEIGRASCRERVWIAGGGGGSDGQDEWAEGLG